MGVVSRSVGNAFRNKVRSGAVAVILAVAIGRALAMLVSNQAVGSKVDSLKASWETTSPSTRQAHVAVWVAATRTGRTRRRIWCQRHHQS